MHDCTLAITDTDAMNLKFMKMPELMSGTYAHVRLMHNLLLVRILLLL